MTYAERKNLVEDFADKVKGAFPQTDQYNVLIFGSFLTNRYSVNSDIDIGVFSLSPSLTFGLYSFIKDYFDDLGMDNDVIRMRLSELQIINLSIIVGQQYAVTGYCPEQLIAYTRRMIEIYGDNPQETVVKRMREEAV